MAELIALTILILSLAWIAYTLWKKIPVLVQLPEISEGVQKEGFVANIKKRIKSISFDKLIFLKTLSKARIYILKAEKFVDHLLQNTRKKIVKKQEAIKKEESSLTKATEDKNKPE